MGYYEIFMDIKNIDNCLVKDCKSCKNIYLNHKKNTTYCKHYKAECFRLNKKEDCIFHDRAF